MMYRALGLISAISIFCCGCGGGTTGTSSTGELKILGTSQSVLGTPLFDAPMTVYSADSDQELAASQTDDQGIFDMSLPPDERAVVVEISGQRTAPLVRSYSGSSVLSTTLYQATSGSFNFGDGLEARLDAESLCDGVTAEGNALSISNSADLQLCTVSLETTSHGTTAQVIAGEVRSECGGQARVTDTSDASSDGSIQLTLNSPDGENCTPKEIVIVTNVSNILPISIPVR